MHPSITQAVASQQIADARRIAGERRRANEPDDAGVAKRPGFSRYFWHAREGHVKPVRRSPRGTGGAGARLT
jgi:hypothetical protein